MGGILNLNSRTRTGARAGGIIDEREESQTCLFTWMSIRVYMYIYICEYLYVYIWIYIYSHVRTHIHTHTHTHTGARAGGIPDLIDEREESRTGYLVPPGDTEAVSKCVNEMAANKDKMREMGARGRIEAERCASPLFLRERNTVSQMMIRIWMEAERRLSWFFCFIARKMRIHTLRIRLNCANIDKMCKLVARVRIEAERCFSLFCPDEIKRCFSNEWVALCYDLEQKQNARDECTWPNRGWGVSLFLRWRCIYHVMCLCLFVTPTRCTRWVLCWQDENNKCIYVSYWIAPTKRKCARWVPVAKQMQRVFSPPFFFDGQKYCCKNFPLSISHVM